jgi:hypothetical protein
MPGLCRSQLLPALLQLLCLNLLQLQLNLQLQQQQALLCSLNPCNFGC